MGNAINMLIDQYTTSVQNNQKPCSYSRIKTFLTLILFGQNTTDVDVKNATKAMMFNNVTLSNNVNLLLEHAEIIGIPIDTGVKFYDILRNQSVVYHQRYEIFYGDDSDVIQPTMLCQQFHRKYTKFSCDSTAKFLDETHPRRYPHFLQHCMHIWMKYAKRNSSRQLISTKKCTIEIHLCIGI